MDKIPILYKDDDILKSLLPQYYKRNVKTIQAYISHLLQFIPCDEECLKWLNEINASGDLVDSKTLPDSTAQKTIEPIIEKSYEVVESMATFTMVKVLKSQKHFHQALAVLEILKSRGRDGERISGEKAEIQQLIKKYTK